ncbi:undecaprenyl-phosphate glucose phosphotransferase [Pectobacterium aroidearum]|uniref:undecaprenyl-phosphate glucose phosphotransferase n=1 Tax=Pectobacterium aroidearum TaxID=1201031 RepID=UPI0015DDC1D5|nr:undecaprenyl-phosphate glucose phosphotransferase [Pectobacterium aroidearum]MBA0205333.1 undecaprenyl-phosphate glucose phosphotransferase [Pectobacterium aroidearum]
MKKNDLINSYANASILSMIQRLSDIIVILSSTLIVSILINGSVSIHHWMIALISLSIFQLISGATDFYRSWRGVKFTVEIKILYRNWLLSVIFGAGILSVIPSLFIGIEYHIVWILCTLLAFFIARAGIRFIVKYLRKLGYNNRKVVVLGTSEAGFHLIKSIVHAPWLGLNVSGYYVKNINESTQRYSAINIKCKGTIDNLIRDAKNGNIDRVYIALPLNESDLITEVLDKLADTTCTVLFVPDIFTFNILQSKSEVINGIPVISLYESPLNGGVNRLIKRIEDIIVSLSIIILISPFLLLISILVKVTSAGPIIFKQKRYGIDGRAIYVWKFRSMTVMEDGENIIQAKKKDLRLTPVGGFLRKTSLDELPQFFNVILGDMSIVGPRPHAVIHNEQYRKLIKGYMLRHKMKPGITGWAQINGWRGETDVLFKMVKRVEFDLYYIQNWSLFFDFKIIFLTIFRGFINKSAY